MLTYLGLRQKRPGGPKGTGDAVCWSHSVEMGLSSVSSPCTDCASLFVSAKILHFAARCRPLKRPATASNQSWLSTVRFNSLRPQRPSKSRHGCEILIIVSTAKVLPEKNTALLSLGRGLMIAFFGGYL